MITEQENQTPVAGRTINIPDVTNSGPEFILANLVVEATKKCPECDNVITGTECVDCTKQTVL